MTNTESRIAVELEELAAAWDDADALDDAQPSSREAGERKLADYGFDSDSRTLVGLGPVERARRSRTGTEAPESQRMPPSEPPGPFIADDEDDEELARSLRGRKLTRWAALPAAALVGLAAMALLRPLVSQAPATGRLAVAAVAPKVSASLNAQIDALKLVAAAPATEPSPTSSAEQPAQGAPTEDASATERHDERSAPERVAAAPHVAAASVPPTPPVVPVKLPELPPPTVIDMSNSADARVGTLNVLSSPPASVVLDGRPIGQAPRIVQVPAGTHTVVFIHPLYGRKLRRVIVNPGKTTAASANF
ncbi:MAG: PEGA domain-containing protein [Myxococcales bacterium]